MPLGAVFFTGHCLELSLTHNGGWERIAQQPPTIKKIVLSFLQLSLWNILQTRLLPPSRIMLGLPAIMLQCFIWLYYLSFVRLNSGSVELLYCLYFCVKEIWGVWWSYLYQLTTFYLHSTWHIGKSFFFHTKD